MSRKAQGWAATVGADIQHASGGWCRAHHTREPWASTSQDFMGFNAQIATGVSEKKIGQWGFCGMVVPCHLSVDLQNSWDRFQHHLVTWFKRQDISFAASSKLCPSTWQGLSSFFVAVPSQV
jgi:hypothetical protein